MNVFLTAFLLSNYTLTLTTTVIMASLKISTLGSRTDLLAGS